LYSSDRRTFDSTRASSSITIIAVYLADPVSSLDANESGLAPARVSRRVGFFGFHL